MLLQGNTSPLNHHLCWNHKDITFPGRMPSLSDAFQRFQTFFFPISRRKREGGIWNRRLKDSPNWLTLP